ncbi:MAG: VCBS repeat-containing protein, partial [Bacteroidota bacterium]
MKKIIPLILCLFMVLGAFAQTVFTEVSAEAGINHAFMVDLATFGGGAAVLDFDKDGFEDVYITGGVSPDVLYHNNGDGTFTDVFEKAGLEHTLELYTQGVSAADVNKDGYKDLLITTMYVADGTRSLAPNLLYLNQG